MVKLTEEINKGLSKATHEESVVKCFTTYVQDLPNGTGKTEKKFFTLILNDIKLDIDKNDIRRYREKNIYMILFSRNFRLGIVRFFVFFFFFLIS